MNERDLIEEMRRQGRGLVSAKEAAEILGMTYEQLRWRIRTGQISFVNVGLGSRPAFRFTLDQVEDVLTNGAAAVDRERAKRSERARANAERGAQARFNTAPRARPEKLIGPHVYVIGFDKFVKIGFTTVSTAQRIKEMQTGVPMPIRVYGQFAGDERLERELHSEFSAFRTNGEWFRRDGMLAKWIKDGCPVDMWAK